MRSVPAIAALLLLLMAGLTPWPALQAQPEVVDVARIRAEAYGHSTVMETADYLTNVIGPRLTNSPGLRRAQQYARERLQSWGVGGARLERWGPFGRGWTFDAVEVSLVSPTFAPLIAYPKAWSSATPGPVEGQPVVLDARTPADVARFRGRLRGRIVLFSPVRAIPEPSSPHRMTDAELHALAGAQSPADGAPSPFQPTPEQRAAAELNTRKWQIVYEEGPAVVVEPGSGQGGTVYVTSAIVPPPPAGGPAPHPWDMAKPAIIPQVVVAAEQYNRLVRLSAIGVPFTLRVNVSARFDDDDPMSGNVIAEIAGSDLEDEIVMFGGCLDSWHAGTGATDNAAGAVVVLEAMRILRAIGVRPRRTIRMGLWSAEEQGRLGSQAYVAAHFGRRVTGADGRVYVERGPEYDRLAGYFNVDWGPGRIRGVYLQGNEAVRPIFRAWLAPFADVGASTLTIRGIGASDHVSFDEIGLPGFQFIRDFMEGSGGPGHTNMDVFDRLSEEDLEQSAAVLAAFAYDLAMSDEKLPRKVEVPRPRRAAASRVPM